LMFHGLRQWDTASAARVDAIMANSSFIQRRVKRAWGRESAIVHPPVPVAEYAERHPPGEFFLWVGQMTRYKRADLALDAFNRLGLPLLMVGDGDLAASLRQRAGPNITIKSKLSFPELKRAYATCRALIFTAEEDFGIVPVEANASGRPVIGYGRGGLVDTIIPEETGLFFAEQSVESLMEAVRAFEAWERHFDPDRARANAARFAPEHFDAGVCATIELAMAQR
ncbi:MAG: glycosyltransferase, partial [Novosphingobium sp.]